MYKHTILRMFSQLSLLLVIPGLAACSGDELIGTPATVDETTIVDTPGGTVSNIRIGSTVSGTFTDGVILVTPATLSAGGTAAITVNLVDANGDPVTTSTTVDFSSPCVSSASSVLSNPTQLTSTGVATTNYLAQGCTGSDVITATLSGTTQSATGNVTVASAAAGSIQFSSVTNPLIALSGTGSASGLPENTTVTFIVKDGLGLPVQGEDVNFTLNSTVGGIALSSITATSDGLGEVITTVQSGTVATSVRVTASLVSDPAIATTSTAIAIATGPPDQDSMTLATSKLNPRAWDINGAEVTISAWLADRFNNPITDGTAISFTTELGSIDPSCTTSNGSCSVIWRSQNPRSTPLLPLSVIDGRTTILATVEGEESFTDFDNDGIFSDGDTFTDLPEAFRDDTENGDNDDTTIVGYDTGEFFVDFNVDGILNPANGLYNGKGCTHSTSCDTIADSVTVRKSIRLVMAENVPAISQVQFDGSGVSYPTGTPTFSTLTDSSISVTIGGADNGQILPVGSTITFGVDNSKIVSGGSHTVANSNAGKGTYTVFIKSDNEDPTAGSLTIDVVVGDGGDSFSFTPIDISDVGLTYSIGGTVSGLPASTTVTLQNNAGNNLAVSANGAFVFTTKLADGDDYAVTVGLVDPAPATCTVGLGTGTVSAADVTDVVVTCIP